MRPSIEAGWVSRRRHLILLVGVVALQIVQPLLAHASVVHRALYDAAFGAVTILVFFAIFLRRWERWPAVVLILPAIVSNVAHYALSERLQPMAATVYHFSSTAFLGFAVAVILRDILRKRAITADDVLGVIAGWVLMGLIWGDITPTRAPAYTLAWLEVMFGSFYMAVIVAQLVGVKLAQAVGPDGRGSR